MNTLFKNYVVQFVLEHGKPEDRALIISKLRGQMLHMARHKFASNVCEKALIMADLDNRRVLIDEIMASKPDGVSPIVTMMKDQFASSLENISPVPVLIVSFTDYVLQRSLMVVEGSQMEELVSKIRPHLVSMRRYSSAYSKHLISSMLYLKCHLIIELRVCTFLVERLVEKCSPGKVAEETASDAVVVESELA